MVETPENGAGSRTPVRPPALQAGASGTATPPHAGHLRVGEQLRAAQGRLVDLGERLRRETDEESATLISQVLGALSDQVLRIAIVGQVNAGKSTLANAMSRRPGLLPTAPVPWTAVATRMHFGLNGFPAPSCHFQFFTDEQWQRLADGGGRLRELAERFLPGFNSEQLQQQIAVVRKRAMSRLGDDFSRLLGTSHAFPVVSRDIIARYVAEGASSPDSPQHYSDMTRSADIFLSLEPFGYPVTLIDTPGSNDPFLVREEITLSCIEASDVCIVVLDATKPLGPSDIGLMRVLHGINAARLIVFLNKFDLLDPADTAASDAITDHVRRTLSREFGSGDIPIITGSALYGEAGHSGGADHPEAHILSGIAALESEINLLLERGPIAHYVYQASATRTALADGSRLAAQSELGQITAQTESRQIDLDYEAQRQRAIEKLREISDDIARNTDRTIQELRLHSYAHEKRTLENLTNLVASYARSKREDLMKILPSDSSKRTVRCDTTELRQLIQVAFIKDYTSVRRDVINTQRLGAVRLRHLMSQAMPDSDIDINFDKLSDEYAVPNQIPLGQMLAIDLEESWWQRWWQRRSGAREAGEALEALIQQEFQPVVEELVAATRTELERVIEGAVLQLSIGSTKVLYAIENQQRQLAAPSHQGALAHPRSSDPTDYALLQIRRDMASNRHERTRRLCDEFSELTAICRRMIG